MLFYFWQAAEQDYEKEKLNERIAKLSGGVAVIQVNLSFFAMTSIWCFSLLFTKICFWFYVLLVLSFEGWSTN